MEPEKEELSPELSQQLELLHKPPHQRSIDDLMKLISSVSQAKFFQDLDPTVRVQTCRALQLEEFLPGETVFQEGDPGDQLYIILEGTVGVFVKEVSMDDLSISRCGSAVASRCASPLQNRRDSSESARRDSCESARRDSCDGDPGQDSEGARRGSCESECRRSSQESTSKEDEDSSEKKNSLTQAQVSTLAFVCGALNSRLSMALPMVQETNEDSKSERGSRCEPMPDATATKVEEPKRSSTGATRLSVPGATRSSVSNDLRAVSQKLVEASKSSADSDESGSSSEDDDDDEPAVRRDSLITRHSTTFLMRMRGSWKEQGCRARRLTLGISALEDDDTEDPDKSDFKKAAARRASVPVKPLGLASKAPESTRRKSTLKGGFQGLRRRTVAVAALLTKKEELEESQEPSSKPDEKPTSARRDSTKLAPPSADLLSPPGARRDSAFVSSDSLGVRRNSAYVDRRLSRRVSFHCNGAEVHTQAEGAVQNLKECLAERSHGLMGLEDDTNSWLQSKPMATAKTPVKEKKTPVEEEIYYSEDEYSDEADDEPEFCRRDSRRDSTASKATTSSLKESHSLMSSDMDATESTRDGDGIFSGEQSDDDSFGDDHEQQNEGSEGHSDSEHDEADDPTSDMDPTSDVDPASEPTSPTILSRRVSMVPKALPQRALPVIQIARRASGAKVQLAAPEPTPSGPRAKERWSLMRRVAMADQRTLRRGRGSMQRRVSTFAGGLLSKVIEVAVLSKGAVFGEVALKSNQPRSATIKTKTKTYVATLSRDDYMNILHDAVQNQQKERFNLLKSLPLSKGMSESALHRLAALLQPRTLQRRESVYEFGAPVLQVFIAVSGQFSVCCPVEEVPKQEHHAPMRTPQQGKSDSRQRVSTLSRKEKQQQDAAFITTAQFTGPAVFGLSGFLRGERCYRNKIICETAGGSIYGILAKELVHYLARDVRRQMESVAQVQEMFHANRMRVLRPLGSQSSKRNHRRAHTVDTSPIVERLQLARGDIAPPASSIYSLEGRLQAIKNVFKEREKHFEGPVESRAGSKDLPPVRVPSRGGGMEAETPLSLQPVWCMEALQKQRELRASKRDQVELRASKHESSNDAPSLFLQLSSATPESGASKKAEARDAPRSASAAVSHQSGLSKKAEGKDAPAVNHQSGLSKKAEGNDAPTSASAEDTFNLKESIASRRHAEYSESAHEATSRLKLAFDRSVFHCKRPSLEPAGHGGSTVPPRTRVDTLDLDVSPTVDKGPLKHFQRLESSKWLKRRLEALGVGRESHLATCGTRESVFCRAPDSVEVLSTAEEEEQSLSLLHSPAEKAIVETPPTTAGTDGAEFRFDRDQAPQGSSVFQGFFSDGLWDTSERLFAQADSSTPRALTPRALTPKAPQEARKLQGVRPGRPATSEQLPEATKQTALNSQDVYRQISKPRSPIAKQSACRAQVKGGLAFTKRRGAEKCWQPIVC